MEDKTISHIPIKHKFERTGNGRKTPLEEKGIEPKMVAIEAVKNGCEKWVFIRDEKCDGEKRRKRRRRMH